MEVELFPLSLVDPDFYCFNKPVPAAFGTRFHSPEVLNVR
jgi:hypothetical protein